MVQAIHTTHNVMNTYDTLSTHGPVPCAGELIEHSGHCQPPTQPTQQPSVELTAHTQWITQKHSLCSWGATQEDRDMDLMWAEIEIYGRKQQQQHSGHRLGTMEYIRFGSTSQTQFFALLLSSVHSNWARRATDLTFPTAHTSFDGLGKEQKSPWGDGGEEEDVEGVSGCVRSPEWC